MALFPGDFLNLSRYKKLWYEILYLPQPYESDDAVDVRAHLYATPMQNAMVLGEKLVALPLTRFERMGSDWCYSVSFAHPPEKAVQPNYNILAVGPDYKWAIVMGTFGTPALWLLSASRVDNLETFFKEVIAAVEPRYPWLVPVMAFGMKYRHQTPRVHDLSKANAPEFDWSKLKPVSDLKKF